MFFFHWRAHFVGIHPEVGIGETSVSVSLHSMLVTGDPSVHDTRPSSFPHHCCHVQALKQHCPYLWKLNKGSLAVMGMLT
jgi:hypothetical protein